MAALPGPGLPAPLGVARLGSAPRGVILDLDGAGARAVKVTHALYDPKTLGM